jgi:hypothetical protein
MICVHKNNEGKRTKQILSIKVTHLSESWSTLAIAKAVCDLQLPIKNLTTQKKKKIASLQSGRGGRRRRRPSSRRFAMAAGRRSAL